MGLAAIAAPRPVCAQGEALQLAEAHRILLLARDAALQVREPNNPSTPLTNIASMLARTGDYSAAFETVKSLTSESDRDLAMQCITWSLADAGNYFAATETARSIKNPDYRMHAFAAIAELQARDGNLRAATATAIGFSKEPLRRAEAFRLIAFGQKEANDAIGAAKTLRSALDFALQALTPAPEQSVVASLVSTLAMIASVQNSIGDFSGALLTSQQIEQLLLGIPNTPENQHLLLSLLEAQVAARDFPAARATVARMQQDHVWSLALYRMANGQAQAGDIRGALEIVAEIKQPIDRKLSLGQILEWQAVSGDTPGALETAELIESPAHRAEALMGAAWSLAAKEVPGPASILMAHALEYAQMAGLDSVQPSFFLYLAETQALIGDLWGGFESATSIKKEESVRADAVGRVAQHWAYSGDVRGALAWAAVERSPLARAEALLGIAEGILDKVDEERARAKRE